MLWMGLLSCGNVQPIDGDPPIRKGGHPPPYEHAGPPVWVTPEPIDPVQGDIWSSAAGTLVWIPDGTFTMGSPRSEWGRYPDEQLHDVTLSGFWMARTEVTQGLWTEVMGENPSGQFADCGDQCPVSAVNWFMALEFLNQLSEREGLPPAYQMDGETVTWDRTSPGYRLPTEAEWEYAAHGGEDYLYAGSDAELDVGWVRIVWGPRVVCRKRINGFGLCDMSGNVWEWVWDRYDRQYPTNAVVNPTGPETGDLRCVRGASWYTRLRRARIAARWAMLPDTRNDDLALRIAKNRRP
ncbi:MAG: SUMF1/EgtB/PvdO family nonheme iron enzyme [Myxococcota bacterium]